jgi:hypothetical protein
LGANCILGGINMSDVEMLKQSIQRELIEINVIAEKM